VGGVISARGSADTGSSLDRVSGGQRGRGGQDTRKEWFACQLRQLGGSARRPLTVRKLHLRPRNVRRKKVSEIGGEQYVRLRKTTGSCKATSDVWVVKARKGVYVTAEREIGSFLQPAKKERIKKPGGEGCSKGGGGHTRSRIKLRRLSHQTEYAEKRERIAGGKIWQRLGGGEAYG